MGLFDFFRINANRQLPDQISRWFDENDPALKRIAKVNNYTPKGRNADLVKEAMKYEGMYDDLSKKDDHDKIYVLKACVECCYLSPGERTCESYIPPKGLNWNDNNRDPIYISRSEAKTMWCDAWKDEQLMRLIFDNVGISYHRRHPQLYADPQGKNIFFSFCYYRQGLKEATKENYESGLRYLNKSIQFNKRNYHAYLLIGGVYAVTEKFEKAIKYVNLALEMPELAVEKREDKAKFWKEKAILHINLDQADEALNACDKCLELNPQDNEMSEVKESILLEIKKQ